MSQSSSPNSTGESNLGPLTLSVFSLVSYAAFFLVNTVLARNLSIHEFNDYNVGVSILLLLAALTPLGLEKFALKILPALGHNEGYAHSRGFLRFSIATVVLVGLALLLVLPSCGKSTTGTTQAP